MKKFIQKLLGLEPAKPCSLVNYRDGYTVMPDNTPAINEWWAYIHTESYNAWRKLRR